MPHGSNLDWTGDVIARLKRLWAEGHSTAEIGRRIGITKNAVIGKVHRLDLAPRPSPIRPNEAGTPRIPRRKPQPAPPLKGLVAIPSVGSTPRPIPAPAPKPALSTSQLPLCTSRRLASSNKACCWPIGDPGQPGFRFCEKPADTGKPYCAAHRAVAYRPRDRECGISTGKAETP